MKRLFFLLGILVISSNLFAQQSHKYYVNMEFMKPGHPDSRMGYSVYIGNISEGGIMESNDIYMPFSYLLDDIPQTISIILGPSTYLYLRWNRERCEYEVEDASRGPLLENLCHNLGIKVFSPFDFYVDKPIICTENGEGILSIRREALVPCCAYGAGYDDGIYTPGDLYCSITYENVTKSLMTSTDLTFVEDSEIYFSDISALFGDQVDLYNKELRIDMGYSTGEGLVNTQTITGIVFIPTLDFTFKTEQPQCSGDEAKIVIEGLPSFEEGKCELRVDVSKFVKNIDEVYPEKPENKETIIITSLTPGKDVDVGKDVNFDLTGGKYKFEAFFDTGVRVSQWCPVLKEIPIDAPPPIEIINIYVKEHPSKNGSGKSYHITTPDGTASGTIQIKGEIGTTYKSKLSDITLSNRKHISTEGKTSIYEYTIGGLKAKAYSMQVSNAKECVNKTPYAKSITKVPELEKVTVVKHDVLCRGEKGSVNFTIKGGFGPYTVELLPKTNDDDIKKGYQNMTGSFEGLSIGDYKIKVTDGAGGSPKEVVFKIEDKSLQLLVTKSDIKCNENSNGQISLKATGGDLDYDFQIGTEGGSLKMGLTANTYECKVTDGSECVDKKPVVIGPAALSLKKGAATKASCSTAKNGSITYTLNGGHKEDATKLTVTLTGTEDRTLSTTSRTILIDDLIPGDYDISVTNNAGCDPATDKFTIEAIDSGDQFKIAITNKKTASCPAIANGQFSISVSNGKAFQDETYQLFLDDVKQAYNYTPNTILDKKDGTHPYTVKLTDANNCSPEVESVTVGVDPNTLKLADPVITLPTCKEASNGEIKLQGENGFDEYGLSTNRYSYSFDGKIYESKNEFTELLSQEYTVYVKDEVGCVVGKEVNLETLDNPISFKLSSSPESCEVADNGEIEIQELKPANDLSITYTLDGGDINPTDNHYTGLNGREIAYKVRITDGNNCFTEKEIKVSNSYESPSISHTIIENLACESASNGAIDVDCSTASTYGLYDSSTNPVVGVLSDDTKFVGLTNQTYKFIATDENGCSSSLDINVLLSENAIHFTEEEWLPTTCVSAKKGIIKVEASGGVPSKFGYTFFFNGNGIEKDGFTAQFDGLEAGIEGSIIVIDATGCSAETTMKTVGVKPNVLQITAVDKTDPICYDTNSGEIKPIVANGIGKLSYSIEKRNESNVYVSHSATYVDANNPYQDLGYGIYRISVEAEDACSSTYEGIKLINPEEAEVADTTHNFIKEKGAFTGEYEITLNGKDKVFSYEFKNITSGEPGVVVESGNLFYDTGLDITKKFESLATGEYRFTLTDDKGCLDFAGSDTFTEKVFIKEPEFELSYTAELITHVSCNGLSDGAINISGYGGWGEYSYSLNGGFWKNSGSFSNLIAGDYSVEIKDREETSITHLITITQPDVFSLDIDQYKDATCPAYANGQVLATSSNGIPFAEGLHYWIENTDDRSLVLGDSHSSNSYVFKELPKGNYELFVSDSHSCADKKSFSIGEPEPAVIEYTNNYIKAKNDASGEISMTITGGNGLFDYECLFNDETIAFETDQTTEAIQLTNLISGTYHILVRDTAACVYEAEEWMKRTIEIKEPDLPLSAEVKEKSEVSCYSLSDGLITLDAIGGWGDYSYSLDGLTWQKDGSYSNLIAGNYSILIRDSVDISYLHEFTISQPDTLNILIDKIKDATCPNYANGQVLATSSNGIPFSEGLHYWIENTDDRSLVLGDSHSSNSYVFKELPKGNYELFVSDSHSCAASKTFSINEPEPAKIELTHNYIKAKGDATGEISMTIAGGNGFFDYQCLLNDELLPFETAQTTGSIQLNSLSAGTYHLLVRDTAACVYEDNEWMERTVEMREPDLALSFEIEEQRNVTCFGLSDAYIKLNAIGGWGDYRFQLDANPQSLSNEFSDLPAAVYQLQITDSVGTSWMQEISIIEPDLLTAEYLSHKDVNCSGGKDGEIQLQIEGGNSDYNLSLNETNWIIGTGLTGLIKGDYNIYVRDEKGCETSLPTITITQPDKIILVNSLITKSRCENNEGSIVTEFTGGVGQLNYQWSKLTKLEDGSEIWIDIPDSNSPSIENLYSSPYIVKVSDEHLCELSFQFGLGDITDLTISNIDVEDVSCFGYKDGKVTAIVENGNSPYTYSWDVNISDTNNELASSIFAGTYNLFVRDSKGCGVSDVFTVGSPDDLSYQIDELVEPLCYGGEKGSISLHAVGGTKEYSYLWDDGSDNNEITDLNPNVYSLTITDAHNCESIFDFEMKYQRELIPFIGNDTLICHYNSLLLDGGDYSEYRWSSDFGFSSKKAQVDLSKPGTYYLQVKDEEQCLGFDTLSLDVSYFRIADLVSTDVTCNDFADGSAQIELTPLNWESTIVWPDGRNALIWDKLSGGNYTVEVEDTYACKDSRGFFIYEPDTLSVDIESLLHPICSDVPNGEIKLIANGGNGDYLYLWSNGSHKAEILDLDQGIYSILIEDQKHCQISKLYDLKYQKTIQNDLGLDFLGSDTLICHYNSLPLDGRDFEKHYWTSDLGYSSSKRFVELNDPDNYYLRIEDEDKCFAYDTIKLSVSYLKIEDLVSTDVTCHSFADARAQIEVSPVGWNHTILWPDGSGAKNWENIDVGTYQVQVKDEFNCQESRAFLVSEPDPLGLEIENLFNPLCYGVANGFIRLKPYGGNDDYSYLWEHGDDRKRLSGLDVGEYKVHVSDKKACQISESFNLVYQRAISPDLGEDLTVCTNNYVNLFPGEFDEYKWILNGRILGTDSELVAWQTGEYSVEVTDQDGCIASDHIKLTEKESELVPILLAASSVTLGDTLMVLEVSQPRPESLTWQFTGTHEITELGSFYCKLVFSEEGLFEMKLKAQLDGCIGETNASILVMPARSIEDDSKATGVYKHLKQLSVFPNPTTGPFEAEVELADVADVTFYLVNIQSGKILDKRSRKGLKKYSEAYNLSHAGVYCIYAESEGERSVFKIVVL